MLQILVLHLMPIPPQGNSKVTTIDAFNCAVFLAAQIAFAGRTCSIVKLHKQAYSEARSQYHLPAQLAIGAMSKAAHAIKRNKAKQPVFEQEEATPFDQRVLSFKGFGAVSLMALAERVRIPSLIRGYQPPPKRFILGQNSLYLQNGTFYLALALDVPGVLPAQVIAVEYTGIEVSS